MQTSKLTRTWALAGAVAAMLAASAAGVRAQDASNPTPAPGAVTPSAIPGAGATTTTTPTGTGSDATSTSSGSTATGSMSSDSTSGSMSTGTMDYHILSNPNYDYVDLMQAKARGLSDSQIATISKIARKSGMPFRTFRRRWSVDRPFPRWQRSTI